MFVLIVSELAVAQGVSVGLILALAATSPRQSLMHLAGVLLVVAAVAAGFLLGAKAPWFGPLFAITAVITAVITTAHTLAGHHTMRRASFRRRLVFALSGRRHPVERE